MPTEPGHYAVAITLMLNLEHHAFVGLVSSLLPFGDDPIEAGALEAAKPIRRHTCFIGRRRDVDRGHRRAKQRFQFLPALLERLATQIPFSLAKQVEEHNRCRGLLRQQLHPGSCWMYAELKYFEVETARRGDNYLAVEYTARRQLGMERLDQFREIAVQ